jgi:diguanylate cyclase (GGDEF)-like protein
MNSAAAIIYWIIVGIWLTIFSTAAIFYVTNRRSFGTTRLLLAVLALDALRNIIENIYFGLYFGAKYGLFPAHIGMVLGNPGLLILPKIGNVIAGCVVLLLLLLKWLPEAIRERAAAERQETHLFRLATVDEMTGLKNRREFINLTEAEWRRCRRYKHPLAFLMIDIDHFKSINDRFGHNVGDEVIAGVGRLCGSETRTSDVSGRMGGEEFAILLPEVETAGARAFADRLRDAIGRLVFCADGVEVAVTVSVGTSVSADCETVAELFKQADTALYEAKRAGRNMVCSFAGGGVEV